MRIHERHNELMRLISLLPNNIESLPKDSKRGRPKFISSLKD